MTQHAGSPVEELRLERIVLWMAGLGSFLAPFMISGVNVALPAIAREFSLDAVSLNWVATSYLLASSVFLLPIGRLADLYGRRRTYLLGLLGFIASSFGLAFSWSFLSLIALRIIQGIAASMVFGTAAAILTSVVPPHRRGRALGITVGSVYAGLSLGPFVGGFLTSLFGWRSLFLFPLPLGIVVFWLGAFRIDREWAEARGEAFDLTGSLLWAFVLPLLMIGVSRLPQPVGAALIAGGMLLALAFVSWETRCASPILRVRLFFENRVFAFSNLAAMVNYAATYAVGFLMSLYLQEIRGFDPRTAGTILVAQPVLQMIFSPIAGRLSDRFEARKMASAGMACTAAGLLVLSRLEFATPLTVIVPLLGFMGFGFALFSSPNINCVMGSVQPREYGIASGILSTTRILGQMLSMGIAMLVFALGHGGGRITAADPGRFMDAARGAFTIFSILCVIGILASLARGRHLPSAGGPAGAAGPDGR